MAATYPILDTTQDNSVASHGANCEDDIPLSPIIDSQVVTTVQKCANNRYCNSIGSFPCLKCHLVAYCSSACEFRNRRVHAFMCKRFLKKTSFEAEKRLPAWAPDTLQRDLIKKHYGVDHLEPARVARTGLDPSVGDERDRERFDLFGDYPAIDVLRLAENEGVDREEPMNLLFIQPDDLRDVIKTILDIPEECTTPLKVVITDCASIKTARSLILLLMALSSYEPDDTAECAVAFWYHAYIPKWCIPAIKEYIGPYFYGDGPKPPRERNDDIPDLGAGFDRTWSFESSSLKARLTYHLWGAVQGILNTCPCRNLIDAEDTFDIAIEEEELFANEDYKDRMLMNYPPALRSGKKHYLGTMKLIPFGYQWNQENWPITWNPSLFHTDIWPLKFGADPLRGWDLTEVAKNEDVKGCHNDIYGKAFYYVRDLFKKFILKLRILPVTFEILPYSGHFVTEKLRYKFDRIETSTLADEDKAGVSEVIKTLAPLLKDPSENPHAVLITLHPNVFSQVIQAFPCPECDPYRAERVKAAVELTQAERELLDAFIPLPELPNDDGKVNWIFSNVGWKRRDARWLFRNPTAAWKIYKEVFNFDYVAKEAGVALKTTNTVVDPWVRRLKNLYDLGEDGRPEPHAQQEFDAVMLTGMTKGYRYAEWRKLTNSEIARDRHREVNKHEPYHEYVSDATLERLREAGSDLEIWMGENNCENWKPY
ncbi:hypothetical protein F4861DRAFT_547060 [Xylaria intraflava]|nr:hypothetical protein F4861DRAFT_547060 [Xylaria intraflava]